MAHFSSRSQSISDSSDFSGSYMSFNSKFFLKPFIKNGIVQVKNHFERKLEFSFGFFSNLDFCDSMILIFVVWRWCTFSVDWMNERRKLLKCYSVFLLSSEPLEHDFVIRTDNTNRIMGNKLMSSNHLFAVSYCSSMFIWLHLMLKMCENRARTIE